MSIPIVITTGATTLATTQVGYTQLNAVARWANISTYFVNVRFHDVMIIPSSLAAAGFCEIAFLRKHLPYNPSTADSSSSAPYSIASLALLPSFKKWNQGNGSFEPAVYPLGFSLRPSTFATDMPVLFELMSYASAATSLLVFVRVTFSSLVTGI